MGIWSHLCVVCFSSYLLFVFRSLNVTEQQQHTICVVCHMCVWWLWRSEEGIRPLGAGVIDGVSLCVGDGNPTGRASVRAASALRHRATSVAPEG